jgi:hypothetical protein
MLATITIVGPDKKMLTCTEKKYWQPFINLLINHDYQLVENLNGDFLIAINHNRNMVARFKHHYPDRPTILIRTEPPAVFPQQYELDVVTQYGLVITPGGNRNISSGNFNKHYPYFYFKNPNLFNSSDKSLIETIKSNKRLGLYSEKHWQNRTILCSFITSNKFGPTKKNNYKLRYQIVSKLKNTELEIFGSGWVAGRIERFRKILGLVRFSFKNEQKIEYKVLLTYALQRKIDIPFVDNKHAINRKSKYSLIVENSNEFLTEKIFDALVSGCIPIYIGPELTEFGIPNYTYIQIPNNFDSIYLFMKELPKLDASNYLNSIYDFVMSNTIIENFDGDKVYEKILRDIDVFVGEFYGV